VSPIIEMQAASSEASPPDVTQVTPPSHADDASRAQRRTLAVHPASGTVAVAIGAQAPGTALAIPMFTCVIGQELTTRQDVVDASGVPHVAPEAHVSLLKKLAAGAAQYPLSAGPHEHEHEASAATGDAKPA
jgi:hypothetical protein